MHVCNIAAAFRKYVATESEEEYNKNEDFDYAAEDDFDDR